MRYHVAPAWCRSAPGEPLLRVLGRRLRGVGEEDDGYILVPGKFLEPARQLADAGGFVRVYLPITGPQALERVHAEDKKHLTGYPLELCLYPVSYTHLTLPTSDLV